MAVRVSGASWARGLWLCALLATAWPARAEAPATEPKVDLLGTWHVLVHYTDDNSSHPDQLRWQDRLWVFERNGDTLEWTEYPILVFSDDTGRFERRGSGQYARVLGGWTPSESQLANIRLGVRTNTRGMKTKKLRGSDAEGWETRSRARRASVSAITFQENWSITWRDGLPEFAQHDVMGSARAESLEGVTLYAAEERPAGGYVIGRFERDGTRHGRFWMRRSGSRLGLDQKDRSDPDADD